MLRTKQFGSYEIIRKLGRGMTDVYLAFDTAANRHAVLKIVEESPDPMTQLVIEAERRGADLQRQLHALDPRVIEVFEYGDRDGCFFLSMQHIEGRTVAAILKEEKRIEPMRAARFAAEICNQLDKLHSFHAEIDGQRRAVVHGDIKPANIQIGNGDEVRLLDFGIAKAITFTHNLTHHNLGSPSYCSPERLAQGKVDHHADLWALGVTLFEMLGGSPPYQAQDTRKLENLIRSRRPPRSLPDSCPSALRAVAAKALSGDLHQRYVSAAAFEADLRAFLQNRPTAAEKERRVAYNTNATVERSKSNGAGPTGGLGATIARKPAGVVIEKLRPAFPKGWSTQRIAGLLGIFTALCWGALAGLLIAVPTGYYYRYSRESGPLRESIDYSRASIAEINSKWDLYQRLQRRNSFLGRYSPAAALKEPLRAGLQTAADEAIDGYRNSNDTDLKHFDWQKSVVCLQYLLRLDERDKVSGAKLALANGYLDLLRDDAGAAKPSFDEAASKQPRDPDPHLGLARICVYADHNVGAAIAELRVAEKLGYRLGPREMEQEADGYRYRAAQELNKARGFGSASRAEAQRFLRMAQRDFEQARQLYEPIEGFSTVSASLREVDDDDRARQELDSNLSKPPPPARKRYPVVGRRRWQ